MSASAPLVAWLLTYLLHSTLLLALAALAAPRLARRSLALEEAVWRAAVFGALLTASLQTATAWRPLAGGWELAELGAGTRAVAPAPSVTPRASLEPPAGAPESAEGPAVVGPAVPALFSESIRGFDWASALLALWAAGALVLLARLALSWLLLRRCLRARAEVSGGTAFRLLARLAGLAPLRRAVRLTCAPHLPVPVAMGVRRPEIALPPRAYAELEEEPLAGLLAHELGHLARRDPAWLLAGQLVGAAGFLQPLNRPALRRLREISELQCDEWSVGRVGSRLSLAQCLAEVARWSLASGHRGTLPAPGMVGRPSQLARRIRRLLDGEPAAEPRLRPTWVTAALAAALLAVAVAAPGVSAGAAAVRPDDEAPPAAAAEQPAEAPPAEAPAAPVAAELAEESTPAERAEPGRPAAAAEPVAAAEPAEVAAPAEAPIGEVVRQRSPRAPALPLRPHRPIDSDRIAEIQRMAERLARESAHLAIRIEPQVRELEREIERISERDLVAITRDVERLLERHTELLGRDVVHLILDVRRIAAAARLTVAEKRELEEAARRLAEATKPTERELEALRDAVQEHRAAMEAIREGALDGMREAIEELHRELELERERDLDEEWRDAPVHPEPPEPPEPPS